MSIQKRQKVKDQKYLIGRLLVKGVKHRIFNCWDIEERLGKITFLKMDRKLLGILNFWDMMSQRAILD